VTRRIFTLANDRLRDKAISVIREARANSRVEIKGPKRSNDANAAMWCKLGDVAEQLAWHGRRLDTEAWKRVFLDALRRERRDEMQFVPNIDGTGWVDLSPVHSSDLSDEEMRDLLTIISAFGDQHGVVWSEPKPKDQRPAPPIEAYEEALR
jgi:hypothetical protein